jgi:hypothetical protein
VERGVAIKGSEVEIIGLGDTMKTTLTGIEMFHKELDRVSQHFKPRSYRLPQMYTRARPVITWVPCFVE